MGDSSFMTWSKTRSGQQQYLADVDSVMRHVPGAGGIGLIWWYPEAIPVSGLFWMKGSAPKPVRRLLLGSLWASILIICFTAAAEPFGVLVPVYPMSLGALWAAKHGTFFKIAE